MSSRFESHAAAVNELRDIDAVESFSERDAACLQEIRDILSKHGLTDRFGVALLHRHFALAEGELLVEFCDRESRSLLTHPVLASAVEEDQLVETVWRFDGFQGQRCVQYCPKDGNRHRGYKDHK